jgi:hypothetical protein
VEPGATGGARPSLQPVELAGQPVEQTATPLGILDPCLGIQIKSFQDRAQTRRDPPGIV